MRKIWFFAKILITIIVVFVALTRLDVKSFLQQYSLLSIMERGEILKAFIEAIAFIVAGFWTYDLYIRNRYDYPYPKIKHRIEHHRLENDVVYLSVFVTLINEGKTKLDLKDGRIYIRQVFPMPKRIKELFEKSVQDGKSTEIRNGDIPDLFIDHGQRIGWDTLGTRDWGPSRRTKPTWLKLTNQNPIIEPGQTKEFQFDFFIEKDIAVIMAVSYINETKGWGLATLYSLKESKTD